MYSNQLELYKNRFSEMRKDYNDKKYELIAVREYQQAAYDYMKNSSMFMLEQQKDECMEILEILSKKYERMTKPNVKYDKIPISKNDSNSFIRNLLFKYDIKTDEKITKEQLLDIAKKNGFDIN